MSGFTLRTNIGMLLAMAMAVVGIVVAFTSEPGTPLHEVGLGIFVLALVVYVAARVVMLFLEPKK